MRRDRHPERLTRGLGHDALHSTVTQGLARLPNPERTREEVLGSRDIGFCRLARFRSDHHVLDLSSSLAISGGSGVGAR